VQRKKVLFRVLSRYVPIRSLWEGPSAPYRSEQSARWQLRQHRAELAAASALAYDRGRLLVDPDLFVTIIERRCIEAAQRRAGLGDDGAGR
jgi:hypothetical protein